MQNIVRNGIMYKTILILILISFYYTVYRAYIQSSLIFAPLSP